MKKRKKQIPRAAALVMTPCVQIERKASGLGRTNRALRLVRNDSLGGARFVLNGRRCQRHKAARLRCQMPAYHAYPPSGADEPKPLPKRLRLSVTVRLVMYLTFL
jgi:hypothetical protein